MTVGAGGILTSGSLLLGRFLVSQLTRYGLQTLFNHHSSIVLSQMWEMNVEGSGSIKTLGNFKTLPDANTKPNVGGSATAVMYDAGKILQMGGNGNTEQNPSSNQASVFDISDISSGNVQVSDTSPMNHPRRYADANVLPDGTVLVNGGSKNSNNDGSDAVLQNEIWNPKTGQWTLGPPAAVYRGYHSSTVLLPNGAVFTSGGGIPGPIDHLNQQIYFPPYLFNKSGETSVRSERPKIVSMSSNSLDYQDILKLEIDSKSKAISEVSFIALPAVTHGFDSNQRRVTLEFSPSNVGIDVMLPSSRNLAPPGYYYLTVVDSNGVPSTSVIVALESAAPVAPPEVVEPKTEATDELINGSFESNTMSSTTYEIVDTSTIPGWKSENGEPMELWKNGFVGISAPDGEFFIELDANAGFPDSIFQDLNTKANSKYAISFAIRSRSGDVGSESEKVYVQWCGKEVNQNGYSAAKAGEWTTINISVIGTGSVCRLTLHESYSDGANNGLGVLLDDVAFAETSNNLIVNGSFEENSIPAGQWKHVPASQVNGWSSSTDQPLEIWGKGLLGVDGVDGSNILELDAATGELDVIYQDVSTQSGQSYKLSFFLRARTSGAETVTVTWSGDTVGSYTAKAEWTKIEADVTGSGGNDRLIFQESSSENDGLGVLLDNISLV